MTSTVEVRMSEQSGIRVAVLEGDIDLANAPDVRNHLLRTVPNTAGGLVVDLSAVTYLDSRGVQLILEMAERLKMRQVKFRVVLPEKSNIRRILLLSHVDTVVPLDENIARAVAMIQQGARHHT
jgi:anti-anti-sigma factor